MIEIIFITALVVLFFHVCTWPGMIFSFVAKALKDLPGYLKKPLYDCPICACIWWGPAVVACGILGKIWQVVNVWQLAIIVSAAAGINTVLIYVINQGKQLAKTLGESECNCTSKEKLHDERLRRLERFVDPLNSR